jgi:hypothetical protein
VNGSALVSRGQGTVLQQFLQEKEFDFRKGLIPARGRRTL